MTTIFLSKSIIKQYNSNPSHYNPFPFDINKVIEIVKNTLFILILIQMMKKIIIKRFYTYLGNL